MATNLEVHRGNHDLLDFCTFRANDAKMQVYHTPSYDIADPRQMLMSVVDEATDQWEKDSVPQFVHKKVISNSCCDTAYRVCHDCTKRVESVTLLTSSYCCKLMN